MNLNLKSIGLSIFFCVLVNCSILSQRASSKDEIRKFLPNALHGQIGSAFFFGNASIYYERLILRETNSGVPGPYFRCGYQHMMVLGYTGPTLAVEAGHILGRWNSHFEMNLGIHLDITGTTELFPVGSSIAYRYQKPSGNFIFRTGLGFPNAVFFSLGLCFGK